MRDEERAAKLVADALEKVASAIQMLAYCTNPQFYGRSPREANR